MKWWKATKKKKHTKCERAATDTHPYEILKANALFKYRWSIRRTTRRYFPCQSPASSFSFFLSTFASLLLSVVFASTACVYVTYRRVAIGILSLLMARDSETLLLRCRSNIDWIGVLARPDRTAEIGRNSRRDSYIMWLSEWIAILLGFEKNQSLSTSAWGGMR